MAETRSDAEAKRKVWEMIRDIEIAMMVTMDDEGRFHGRPMAVNQTEFDGVLWFFTESRTPKTSEVDQDDRVLLAYADPRRQNYVSIYGSAEVVHDVAQQKALWSEPLRTWFPDGPESPSVSLLKVTCLGAEYWDTPSSTVMHAYGYVKAALTGKAPNPGENEKVDFTPQAG
jgi:general stress protein 26